jgi:uncharacterized protein
MKFRTYLNLDPVRGYPFPASDMERYLESFIRPDLDKKIILLSGPRQVGKTYLSRSLRTDYDYVNFDVSEHRRIVFEKSWDRSKSLLILDELHKMKRWKQWLKGVYDTEGRNPSILVTGSARLDTFKKVGDSLAGRYFSFNLLPLDLKEVTSPATEEAEKMEILDTFLTCSGFPEPFLEGSERFYRRWQKTHLDIILRQDLIETTAIESLVQIETLVELMRSRVGQLLSIRSLSEDLQVDDKTVKRWLTLLEHSYLLFKITPFHSNISRSLLKASKYYFYDYCRCRDHEGGRLENLVALSLLKEATFRNDCFGERWHVHFLRTKDQREVDFAIALDGIIKLLVEVKWKDDDLHGGLRYFCEKLPGVKGVQLVKDLKRDKTFPNGVEVRHLANWLASLDFSSLRKSP